MRGKPIRNKNKILVALVALFTMLMCTSVGFATWITAGGSSGSVNGNIEADDYVEVSTGDAYCISSLVANGFRYSASYGLVDEDLGLYGNTAQITGAFTLDLSEAKTAISSLNSTDKKLSLKLDLTASVTTNFTFSSFVFSGFANTSTQVTSSSYSSTHNIVLTSTEYSQNSLSGLGFSINVAFSGSTLPDLSSASYSITISPGEYVE